MRFSRSVLLFTVVACAKLWAQSAVSQISGTVHDASGLAVPDAEIRVIQSETGLTRTAASGPDGTYLLPSLPVGPYRMEV